MSFARTADGQSSNSWLQHASRQLWRSLPVTLRQKAARELISRLRLRLSAPVTGLLPDRGVKRIVVGLLSSASGLGQSARLTAKALQDQGFKVLGIDLTRYFYEDARIIQHGLP